MLSQFVNLNVEASRGFDRIVRFPPRSVGNLESLAPEILFAQAKSVGDVGGGKKPFAAAAGLDAGDREYVGLDIDPAELAAAPAGTYTRTEVIDICRPPAALHQHFDLIICRNTLEHVQDAQAALAGLFATLEPGGRCFVKVPCRKAAFARLNRALPERLKRRLMHGIFPHKKGDGFPAFYDRATPRQFRRICNEVGFRIIAERRNLRSSYFSFLFPLYVLWRAASSIQYGLDPDYCESFEMVLDKPKKNSP